LQRFHFHPTSLSGLTVVERTRLEDSRGFLSRFFCLETMAAIGMKPIQQINHTLTKKAGAVRGMHFQHPPSAEIKIVSCLKGRVLDVAVDLRAGSPTLLQWFAVELSDENKKSLFIPEGFAHGFQTLTEDCELLYLHTADYSPQHESALNPLDPRLSIEWPLAVTEISARDQSHPMLDSGFRGIKI
jgi:dTDP-4-dehydrorhamnose 3,5-epimerase